MKLLWKAAAPLLLAMTMVPVSRGAQGNRASAAQLFHNAQEALAVGDLDRAEANFRAVLAADPRAASAYANLGVIAMRRKDWNGALHLLKKAESLDPKIAGIRLNIGLVEYREGRYEAAIAPLQSVLRDQPDSGQARYLLGLAYLFTNKFTDAVATLEPLWPRNSNDVMYLYALDMAAHNAQQTELDEKTIRQMISVGEDTPQFHLILGKAFLNRREDDKARAEFERAAQSDPHLPYLHFNLGLLAARRRDWTAAEDEFRKDIAVEPDLPDNYEQLGKLYMDSGDDKRAEAAFQQALDHDAHSEAALLGLAGIYRRQDKYAAALSALDKAVKANPRNHNAHFLRGQVLQRLSRRTEAEAEFAEAKKLLNSSLATDREKLDHQSVPSPELQRQP
jgi:tetratricopeptide (TPR) repeat protein